MRKNIWANAFCHEKKVRINDRRMKRQKMRGTICENYVLVILSQDV